MDVVLDYLWGRSAEQLLIAGAKAGPDGRPIRFVQVGSMSGADITLPSAVLRGSAIELMGSGISSVSIDALFAAVAEMFAAVESAGFEIATNAVPLADVEAVWDMEGPARTVLVTGD